MLFLSSSLATLSQNIVVETFFKVEATTESIYYVEKKLLFTLLEKENILKVKDIESNTEKSYNVEFSESFNFYNSPEFVKSYVSRDEKNGGMFSIIYTKENGELIGVMMQLMPDFQTSCHLTKLGKEVFKFKM